MNTPTSQLSEQDRAILVFADSAPRTVGAREEAIMQQLGISPMRYYQRLNGLIDTAAARREFPVLCARLSRLREQTPGSGRQ